MSSLTGDVGANLIAGFVGGGILTTFGILLASALNKRKILRFFRVGAKRAKVGIYVSRLGVQARGATGVDEDIQVGYVGGAVSDVELRAALMVRDLLRTSPVAVLPRNLAEWIGNRWPSLHTLDPTIAASPAEFDGFAAQAPDAVSGPAWPDVVILIGSSVYNPITRHYLDHVNSAYRFCRHDRKLILRSQREGDVPGRPEKDAGIVQRITDHANHRTVFICAGLSAEATFASVHYLVDRWEHLNDHFKEPRDFVVCLGFDVSGKGALVMTEPPVEKYHDMRLH